MEKDFKHTGKKLENKLKAVQDLKSSYYIGTGEAWNYLKQVNNIYEIPVEMSNKINEIVNPSTYYATPERVYGLLDTLDEICINADYKLFPKNCSEKELLYKQTPPGLFSESGGCLEIIGDNYQGYFLSIKGYDKELVINSLSPFFKDANVKKIKTDKDFGRLLIDGLKYEYIEIKDRIYEEELIYPSHIYFNEVIKNLNLVNWNSFLSKDNLRRIEKKNLRIAENNLNIPNMIKRLFRDQVDHRLEYRRAVLSKWLLTKEFKDYEECLDHVERVLNLRNKRLQEMVDFGLQNFEGVNIFSREKDLIREAQFIRHLLGSEKNFVNKFLRS